MIIHMTIFITYRKCLAKIWTQRHLVDVLPILCNYKTISVCIRHSIMPNFLYFGKESKHATFLWWWASPTLKLASIWEVECAFQCILMLEDKETLGTESPYGMYATIRWNLQPPYYICISPSTTILYRNIQWIVINNNNWFQ